MRRMNNIHKLILISCLCHFIVGCLVATRGILIESISTHFHLSTVQLGYVYTLCNIGIIISLLLTGPIIQHFDLKKIFSAFYCTAVIAITALNFFHDIYSYSIVMILLGFVSGFSLSGGSYLLVASIRHTDKSASKIILTDLFFSMAGMMFPAVFGYLLVKHVMWYSLYNVLIVPCVLALFIIQHTDFSCAQRQQEAVVTTVQGSKLPVFISAGGSFFFVLFELVFNMWLAEYLQQYLHFDFLTASLFVTLYWLAKASGLLVNHLLILKIGTIRYLAIASWTGLAAMVLMFQSTSYHIIVILMLILGFASSAVVGSLVSYACSELDCPCPKTVGLIYIAGTAGSVLSAWLSSLVVSFTSVFGAMLLSTAAYCAFFLCMMCIPMFAAVRRTTITA